MEVEEEAAVEVEEAAVTKRVALALAAGPAKAAEGTMVAEGQEYFLARPWVCLSPGLAILTVVLGFNLLGDAIGDRLDPRRNRAVA